VSLLIKRDRSDNDWAYSLRQYHLNDFPFLRGVRNLQLPRRDSGDDVTTLQMAPIEHAAVGTSFCGVPDRRVLTTLTTAPTGQSLASLAAFAADCADSDFLDRSRLFPQKLPISPMNVVTDVN
jgi:hypothetical protein